MMHLTLRAAALLAVLLACSAGAGAQSEAARPSMAALPSSYAKDLQLIMEANHVYERVTGVVPPATVARADREFNQAFLAQVTRSALHQRLEPVFASRIGPERAAELAKLMRHPVMRRRQEHARSLPKGTTTGYYRVTSAEAAQLRQIDASPAMREWHAHFPALSSDIQKIVLGWAQEYGAELHMKSMRILGKLYAGLRERGRDTAQPVAIERVGLAYMDKMVGAIGQSMIAMHNAYARFEAEHKRLGYAETLKAAQLVTAAGRASSRQSLDGVEAALEILLKDFDAALREREAGMREVDFAGKEKFILNVEQGLGYAHGYFITFGEAFRRLLDQQRRVVAFVEERKDKLVQDQGSLLFASEAEAAAFNSIVKNTTAAAVEAARINAEQVKKDEAFFKNGGVTLPQKPD